jgi:anti-anti-sigma factor
VHPSCAATRWIAPAAGSLRNSSVTRVARSRSSSLNFFGSHPSWIESLHQTRAIHAAASSALAQTDVVSVRSDMSQVSFLDSSGLGALVALHHAPTEGGKSLVVWKLQPGPRRTVELMSLQTLQVIEPTDQ